MNSPGQLPFDFSLKGVFTFQDFFVADSNSELVSNFFDQDVLSEQFYFIWGVEGAGKSHLLQSLCQSRENAVYVSLQSFSKHGPEILSGLENMSLVCLDDIESILGDQRWEEGVFQFFNAIRETGNNLIISASSSPRNLNIQIADLASRLGWGVVYQVHELDDSEKGKALELRIANRGIPLNTEVLDYILLRSPRSMDALFNVLETLDQLSLAEQRRITIPFVRNIMNW